MRDERIKKAFIEYLERGTDERFFQALANFTHLSYIGSAETPNGDGYIDLWNIEADETIEWKGKDDVLLGN